MSTINSSDKINIDLTVTVNGERNDELEKAMTGALISALRLLAKENTRPETQVTIRHPSDASGVPDMSVIMRNIDSRGGMGGSVLTKIASPHFVLGGPTLPTPGSGGCGGRIID